MRNLLMTFAAVVLMSPAGRAIEIELQDVGGTPLTAEQRDAFRTAAERWEKAFVDPITVRINVGFDGFNNAALGETRIQRTTHAYRDVREALLIGATSFAEAQALNALPAASLPLQDVNGARADGRITLSTANAKALGLAVGLDPFYGDALPYQADASIRFNEKYANGYDYDPADGISPRQTDFVALATREIGHALGFTSMIDLQDNEANARYDVHPSTLDVWRFKTASTPHNLTAERRQLTAGPTEFFDGSLQQAYSFGMLTTDPLCDAANERCGDSYWRDPLDRTFTPTLPLGATVALTNSDIHALDAIGYERPSAFDPRQSHAVERLVVGWFEPSAPAPCLDCGVPEFPSGEFDDFAPPPAFSELPPELRGADLTLGVRIGLDLGVDGMRKRSGLGFATFRKAIANREQFNYAPGDVVPGEQNLLPAVQFPEELPAAVMDFYFRSDTTAGASFTFIAELGEMGAPFDPTIGDFGGYRITGFLDGDGDGVDGDQDGRLTFYLAADGPGGPDGVGMSIYQLALGDNDFFDADGFAFEFGTFIPGDTYPFDGKVDLTDLNNVRNHFGEEGDYGLPGDTPRFDGKVDLTDLNAVRNNFGYGVEDSNGVPEPSALALFALLVPALYFVRRGTISSS